MTRLDSVCAGIGAEQRIAILLCAVVVAKLWPGVDLIKIRVVNDEIARETRQVGGADALLGIVEPSHITEARSAQAEFLRTLVHPRHERFLRSRDALRQHYTRIVCRNDHCALNEVTHGDHGIYGQEHMRPARWGAVLTPSVFTDLVLRLVTDAPGLQLLQHDQHRHQLSHRGRWDRRIAVLAVEDRTGGAVHDRNVLRHRRRRSRLTRATTLSVGCTSQA